MNTVWRTILRTRALAAIRIHRKHASPASNPRPVHLAVHPTHVIPLVLPPPRPYIHILFRRDAAEAWMTQEMSMIPANWLKARGFHGMEYYDVKVGVAPA